MEVSAKETGWLRALRSSQGINIFPQAVVHVTYHISELATDPISDFVWSLRTASESIPLSRSCCLVLQQLRNGHLNNDPSPRNTAPASFAFVTTRLLSKSTVQENHATVPHCLNVHWASMAAADNPTGTRPQVISCKCDLEGHLADEAHPSTYVHCTDGTVARRQLCPSSNT